MMGALQEAVLEAVKEDFVSDRDLNNPEVQPWCVRVSVYVSVCICL